MAEHSGAETFIAGFLIGGVIGAGVALLFAPASGKETREYLKTQVGHAIEGGKDEFAKLRDLIREEIARFVESKDAFKEAMQAGVEAYKKHGKVPEGA